MSRSEHRRKPRKRRPNINVKNVAVLEWELDDDISDDLARRIEKNLREHSDTVFSYALGTRCGHVFGLWSPRFDLLRRSLCSSLGDVMVNDANLLIAARTAYRAHLTRQRRGSR